MLKALTTLFCKGCLKLRSLMREINLNPPLTECHVLPVSHSCIDSSQCLGTTLFSKLQVCTPPFHSEHSAACSRFCCCNVKLPLVGSFSLTVSNNCPPSKEHRLQATIQICMDGCDTMRSSLPPQLHSNPLAIATQPVDLC